MVDARLTDGSRVHAVLAPIAPDGPVVTIRKHRVRRVELDEFGLGEAWIARLAKAVQDGSSILISGATNCGKTTFLNALSTAIPNDERVVTIEETVELQLRQDHVVRLEARTANAEGKGAVTVRELIRTALRMRPDRLIVGEVRGDEAIDLLLALNTGHRGSLTTVHANSASDALLRIATLTQLGAPQIPLSAIYSQIGAAFDLLVHLHRDTDGARRVVDVVSMQRRPIDQQQEPWTLQRWEIERPHRVAPTESIERATPRMPPEQVDGTPRG